MHFLDESHIYLFLTQVFIMLLLARGLGEIFIKFKQPSLTAEILAGIILGPTILGRFFPEIHTTLFPDDIIQKGMIETVAWLGIMFLLLDTGLEIDFSIAWRQRGNALIIALSDIILPMAIAFIPAVLLPDKFLADPEKRIIFGLFMATVMTISAMPVAARMFHDFNMLKTELGFLVVSALAVNDLIGWVLFTIILGVFLTSSLSVTPVILVFITTIGFSVFAIGLGRKISTQILQFLKNKGLKEPATSLTCVCLLGMLFGAFTEKLGIGSLYGFFIAGIVMGEAKNLSEETRGIISQMVHAIFVPLFFANIGLKVDFAANFNWWIVLLMTIVGIFGRYIGAWLGVTLTNVPRVNRNIVSIAHTPGGMMEIVVALVALESGLITQEIFVAIVFSAVFSCVIAGPWLAKAMSKRATVSILDFIKKDFIFILKNGDKEAAIRELVQNVAEKLKISPDNAKSLAEEVLKRENEFSTCVGRGLAIPHVRTNLVLNPVLAYGRLSKGSSDWDSPDGVPVRGAFFLLIPEGIQDLHVQILSQIVKAFKQKDIESGIRNATDIESAWTAINKLFS